MWPAIENSLIVLGYPPLPNDHDGFSCGAHKYVPLQLFVNWNQLNSIAWICRDYGCLTYVSRCTGRNQRPGNKRHDPSYIQTSLHWSNNRCPPSIPPQNWSPPTHKGWPTSRARFCGRNMDQCWSDSWLYRLQYRWKWVIFYVPYHLKLWDSVIWPIGVFSVGDLDEGVV